MRLALPCPKQETAASGCVARTTVRRRDAGAVTITAALMLLFLLGFMGVAIDIGRAFVVRSELQTAMDSCALAGAQELDGSADAIARATSAGLAAAWVNRVGFQSESWSGQGQLPAGGIGFRDASFVLTTAPAAARYVSCTHTQPNVRNVLLGLMGAFAGSPSAYPAAFSVKASAVATRAPSQTSCPVPLALKPKSGGTAANDYGFAIGEWVTLLMGAGAATNGQIGWANLDGSNDANETAKELDGYCGTKVGDKLGTPGVQTSVADNWNYRFGIYKNSVGPAGYAQRPDFTGYAYTLKNWPSGANAFDGATPPAAPATAGSFVGKRQAYASCADTGTQLLGGPNSCEGITGLSLNSFQKLAPPGNVPGGHRQYGMNRRMVIVPVPGAANTVTDYACMLMLQPLSIPLAPVQLEYRGRASAAGSPCGSGGLAGGSVGPLVPVLVR